MDSGNTVYSLTLAGTRLLAVCEGAIVVWCGVFVLDKSWLRWMIFS